MFCERMLPVAKKAFGQSFEALFVHSNESVRLLLTAFPPYVGAIAFYGILTGTWVELVDVEVDDDYWDTTGIDVGL
jgi:hypothetical protein